LSSQTLKPGNGPATLAQKLKRLPLESQKEQREQCVVKCSIDIF